MDDRPRLCGHHYFRVFRRGSTIAYFVTLASVSLWQAAIVLDRSVPHLVRSFTRTFGVSPHAYIIGRCIETARGLLLAGGRPAVVATTVGFYDHSHFTRHFRRHTSVAPGRYAASHP
ncbi:MAG: hypothetical protein DLM59_02065 [Pseudonocardiales bacterium]|nr:MAG: hypothetical protein DLM59_02065 [Pseudonocardiales bacterium]